VSTSPNIGLILGELQNLANGSKAANDHLAAQICLQAKVAIEELQAEVAEHHRWFDAVPTLGDRRPDAPEGLRFLAQWFDAMYGGAETGSDWVQQDLRKWAERFGELQAIVDSVRKTADGVPVVGGMRVFPKYPIEPPDVDPESIDEGGIVYLGIIDSATGDWLVDGDTCEIDTCYSTREAAEAAKEKP
jgi:hypothetical protein